MKSCHQKEFGPVLATDSLGRKLLTAEETGGPKQDKERKVGMFYFLCNGENKTLPPRNISQILEEYPEAKDDLHHPAWGKVGGDHHWGEPFWGYFIAKDEWVARKHMQLLVLADVDFLFFDTTNALYYEYQAKMVMRILDEYRRAGWKAPQVLFYTNTCSGETIQGIYENIYKENYMPETWFRMDGKPVIIGNAEDCSPETREFFNIQVAQWPNAPDKVGGWPWMDFTRPQRLFADENGKNTIVNVSLAQHPQIYMGDSVMYGEKTNRGRSFHHGVRECERDPEAYQYGYNVEEQWERAYELDPDIVLVTGWNEWVAGKWGSRPGCPVTFVDCATLEYSRDIDLMRGGYFDNYYMQLINNIRRYKGTEEIPVQQGNVTIDIKGSMKQWRKVEPEYQNFPGAMHRDVRGYGRSYQNYTLRNGILAAKVASDQDFLYFYARTATTLSYYDGEGAWMRLYIRTGERKTYDFVANYKAKDEKTTTLLLGGETGFGRDYEADLEYRSEGNEIHLKIPKKLLGIEEEHFTLQFKWADSREEITSYEDLYENGNSAPIGRLNYVYRT